MKIFLCSFICALICTNTLAQVIWSESQAVSAFSDHENIIEPNVVLTPVAGSFISVTDSVEIINHGTIDAGLSATDNNLIQIHNFGNVSGIIQADRVTQVITPDVEFGGLNIQTDYFSVSINDFSTGVNLTDLQNLHADHYEFRNSKIIVDNFAQWQDWAADIEWSGANILHINASEDVVSGTSVNNAQSSSVIIEFAVNDGNNPYVDYTNQDPILNVITESDYKKLFNDAQAAMLQEIRNSNPDDKMILAMNSAHNINELRDIVNSSYRFNPSVLMRPIIATDNFSMLDNLIGNDVIGGGVVPFYMGSKYMDNRGMYLYMNALNDENLSVNVDLRLNKFDYEDDVNVFDGIAYGADVNVSHKMDDFLIKGHIGFNVVDFDADHIYVDGDIKNNPFGYSLYGGIDGFYDYKISENIYLTPFVGGVFHHYSVLNADDLKLNLRGGGGAKYNYTIDGIKYEYAVYAGGMTNGDMFGLVRMGFDSVVDRIGTTVSIGVFKDEFAWNYRVSCDVRFSF